MPTPTIINGQEQFFTVTYEGNGGGMRVGNFVPFTDSGTIANSIIFDRASSSYLARTPSSTGNAKTFTFSCWFKKGNIDTSNNNNLPLLNAKGTSNEETFLTVGGDEKIRFDHLNSAGSTRLSARSTRTLEARDKWYHIVLRIDTTQSDTDKIRIYIDGDLQEIENTTYNDDEDTAMNTSSKAMQIGKHTTTSVYGDFYIAEVNHCDGQSLAPSTFGLTDTSTGNWIPKTLSGITYGTNGFRLTFADSSALGDDTSGNGNDFSSTNLASTDQTIDSPSQNFATLTPNRMKSGFALSEGNLKMQSDTTDGLCMSGMRVSGGKFYIETEVDAFTNGGSQGIGFCEETLSTSTDPSGTADVFGIFSNQTDFVVLRDGAYAQDNGGAVSAGDIVQIAFDGSDLGNAKFYLGINNSKWYYEDMSENSSFDATRPTLTLDLRARTNLRFYVGNRASTGSPGSSTYICNFGQKSYSYTAPTGFGSFNQDALPETDKGLSDFVWAKSRDNTESHTIYDSSRGPQKQLSSNLTAVENTQTDGLQKFLKGGYSCEDHERINQSGISYVSWNWVANGATTASNTNGSITSTVQANTTAGFSIVTYSGSNDSTVTWGHGLSSSPEWVLIKRREGSGWRTYHKSVGLGSYLSITGTGAAVSSSVDFASVSSTTFGVKGGNNPVSASSQTYVAYCWHGVEGFSKFGSYTGNGNADGPFVFTGFKPAWVMVKDTDDGDQYADWSIFDSGRNPFNIGGLSQLRANLSNAEITSNKIDLLSNGFKLRGTGTRINESSHSFIFMAFAEHPFVGDGTNPVTAR